MRDYLEELLEALEEPEEDGDVPELGRLSVPVSAGESGEDVEPDAALIWSGGGASGRSGGDEWASGEWTSGESKAHGEYRGGVSQEETAVGGDVGRKGGPGDLVAKALDLAEPLWMEDDGVVESGGGFGSGARAGQGALSLEWEAPAGRVAGGSAAALERRLAERMDWADAPGRGAERVVVEERSGGGMDLEELDRRLERDARRYDGGIFLY